MQEKEENEHEHTWTSPVVPSKNNGLEHIDVTHGQIQQPTKSGRHG